MAYGILNQAQVTTFTQKSSALVWRFFFYLLLSSVVYGQGTPNVKRSIPVPLPGHPGNIFLQDEEVIVALPSELSKSTTGWKVLDDRDKIIAAGLLDNSSSPIKIGKRGIGWYKIQFLDDDQTVLDHTTAAVLSKLVQPVPQDSPICVDAAVSWLAKNDPLLQNQLSNLAALAGVNWIRDRLSWREIEPEKGVFAKDTQYHAAAIIQNRNGFNILQTYHDTPKWAVAQEGERGRFPQDLRMVYRACRQFGEIFSDSVQAWEPWNEANAAGFGGHTMAEMCSYQKAAFLGFKAGNPDTIVCWNPYGGINTEHHAKGILENETWPYFDTYNIHSYNWPDSYLRIREAARKAACGKPIWLTECDRGIHSLGNAPWYDLSDKNNLLKAQFMAQSYACSLGAGVDRHFHFILGDYTEGGNHPKKIQFGLLRKDLTPRPAYVALAALGRLLAGAECLGRYGIAGQPDCYVYGFQACPDGKKRDVIVAWAEKLGDWPERGQCRKPVSLPKFPVEEVFDYLGRSRGSEIPPMLTSEPIFMILPSGALSKLPLNKPEKRHPPQGAACPVVLQIAMADSIEIDPKVSWIIEPRYKIQPGRETEIHFFAYNFSSTAVAGQIQPVKIPQGWKLTPADWSINLEPMQRASFTATLDVPLDGVISNQAEWIKLQGDFSNSLKPVLAFSVVLDNEK